MLPATPNPPPILTAPVVLEVEAVVSEKVGAPVKVPDNAPPLIVGDVRVLFVRVCVPVNVATDTMEAVPLSFLKNRLPSYVLSANSPSARSPVVGVLP
jgi:hypothetical protein